MKYLLLLLLFVCAFSCQKGTSSKSLDGKKIFKLNCSLCHGIDGTLQANGSKDLSLSTLTKEERIFIIRKGKGVMTPFENVLTPEEIASVAAYTMTLKNTNSQ